MSLTTTRSSRPCSADALRVKHVPRSGECRSTRPRWRRCILIITAPWVLVLGSALLMGGRLAAQDDSGEAVAASDPCAELVMSTFRGKIYDPRDAGLDQLAFKMTVPDASGRQTELGVITVRWSATADVATEFALSPGPVAESLQKLGTVSDVVQRLESTMQREGSRFCALQFGEVGADPGSAFIMKCAGPPNAPERVIECYEQQADDALTLIRRLEFDEQGMLVKSAPGLELEQADAAQDMRSFAWERVDGAAESYVLAEMKAQGQGRVQYTHQDVNGFVFITEVLVEKGDVQERIVVFEITANGQSVDESGEDSDEVGGNGDR